MTSDDAGLRTGNGDDGDPRRHWFDRAGSHNTWAPHRSLEGVASGMESGKHPSTWLVGGTEVDYGAVLAEGDDDGNNNDIWTTAAEKQFNETGGLVGDWERRNGGPW